MGGGAFVVVMVVADLYPGDSHRRGEVEADPRVGAQGFDLAVSPAGQADVGWAEFDGDFAESRVGLDAGELAELRLTKRVQVFVQLLFRGMQEGRVPGRQAEGWGPGVTVEVEGRRLLGGVPAGVERLACVRPEQGEADDQQRARHQRSEQPTAAECEGQVRQHQHRNGEGRVPRLQSGRGTFAGSSPAGRQCEQSGRSQQRQQALDPGAVAGISHPGRQQDGCRSQCNGRRGEARPRPEVDPRRPETRRQELKRRSQGRCHAARRGVVGRRLVSPEVERSQQDGRRRTQDVPERAASVPRPPFGGGHGQQPEDRRGDQ